MQPLILKATCDKQTRCISIDRQAAFQSVCSKLSDAFCTDVEGIQYLDERDWITVADESGWEILLSMANNKAIRVWCNTPEHDDALSFKLCLGEEKRRVSMPPACTLEEVIERVCSIYGITSNPPTTLVYTDDESDNITVTSTDELREAIKCFTNSSAVTLSVPALPDLLNSDDGDSSGEEVRHSEPSISKPRGGVLVYPSKRLTTRPRHQPPKQTSKVSGAENGAVKFVKDVTLPNGCLVAPGVHLKTWRIKNNSDSPWKNVRLEYIGGKGAHPISYGRVDVPFTSPGRVVDVTMPLLIPQESGRYVGYFKLCQKEGNNDAFIKGRGKRFGPRLWAEVVVESSNDGFGEVSLTDKLDSIVRNLQKKGFEDPNGHFLPNFVLKYNMDVDKYKRSALQVAANMTEPGSDVLLAIAPRHTESTLAAMVKQQLERDELNVESLQSIFDTPQTTPSSARKRCWNDFIKDMVGLQRKLDEAIRAAPEPEPKAASGGGVEWEIVNN